MSADKDLISVQQARNLVESASKAQAEVARFDQAKIDRICEAMSKAALRESARLGALAVEETGYGIPDDKREKNRFAAEDVWNYFRGLRTVGVVSESKDVVEIASPRGVVREFPSTNQPPTQYSKSNLTIPKPMYCRTSCAARCINEARAYAGSSVKKSARRCNRLHDNRTIEGTDVLMIQAAFHHLATAASVLVVPPILPANRHWIGPAMCRCLSNKFVFRIAVHDF